MGKLAQIREKILADGGTVLDSVTGEVTLDDRDDDGKPRLGPVLVLGDIEKESVLRIAHPRPVTVLGSLSGQVFGAYKAKVGNLLSGRLEGTRHVEVVHDLTSIGDTNEDAWLVFEATSDPGFFRQAQHGLDKLRAIEGSQRSQRESAAQTILLNSLRDVPYKIDVSLTMKGRQHRVFAVTPGNSKRPIHADLKPLLIYLFRRTDSGPAAPEALVERFKFETREVLTESIRRANSEGLGSGLRSKQGDDAYEGCVKAVEEYLLPKLLRMWLHLSEGFVQQVIDRLASAPMILDVGGQLKPYFQIEYPRWKFHVVGSKIVHEKIADCNIAFASGSKGNVMSLTYSYIAGETFHTDMIEVEHARTRKCRLILRDGAVYLSDDDEPLFRPPDAVPTTMA